ncbi:hypothetical protein I4U23_017208 [Adineta vaga]|nr:hypothetical protein I4U23_017208 [Adineta vaga]
MIPLCERSKTAYSALYFRVIGSLIFQILSSFCRLAQDSINSSLPKFYSTRFISNELMYQELLNNQSQSSIDLYIQTTAENFAYSFNSIRDTAFGNGLVSGLLTNFDFEITQYIPLFSGHRVIYKPTIYKQPYTCDCSVTPTCISPIEIHDNITGDVVFIVPGLYKGCLLVEAVRQSNLQCLYSQACLEQINQFIQSSISFHVTPLNVSILSRYNITTNINELLGNLMTESWIKNISYSSYYYECKPSQCTYTKVGKNNAIYIVTALLGLFGGLYKTLYLLVPILIKTIRRRREKLFYEKVQHFIMEFIQSTTKMLSYDWNSIRLVFHSNMIVSGLNTDSVTYFQGTYPSLELAVLLLPYETCRCFSSAMCSMNALIFFYNSTNALPIYTIPGFYIGCYIDDAVRISTLECYFNQSCVDLLKLYLNYSKSFETKSLNPNDIKTYNVTSTINDLFKNAIVEQWLSNNSYKNYYEKCRSTSLKVLRIVVPFLVRSLRHRRNLQDSQLHRLIRLRHLMQKAIHSIRYLNLFRSDNVDNEYRHRNQLISTRLFICLLLLSMIILLIYTSQVSVTHIITIDQPSLEDYSSLYEKHSKTLVCPCLNIGIDQEKFITLIPIFHQVCQSDFIDARWLIGIANTIDQHFYIYNRDFRLRGYSTFSALASVCSLAKINIFNALIDFNSSTFISNTLFSESRLLIQANASIDFYITSMSYSFSRSFGIIRDTIQGNGFISSILSSITLRLITNNKTNTNGSIGSINPRYKTYDNGIDICSCHDSAICIEQQYVHTVDNTNVPIYKIPGMVIGCYGFEAMLQSNLFCFFNQTCIDGLRTAIGFYENFSTQALDLSKLIYFDINSTIGSIMDKAMIEKWTSKVNYTNYYDQCRPIYCKYTYVNKNDVIYIFTTLFALIGGLVSILQLLVPCFVKLIRKMIRKWQQRRVATNIDN